MTGLTPCMQHILCQLGRAAIPPSTPLLSLLKTITDGRKLRKIHAQLLVSGDVHDPFVASHLLASPALCESNYTHLIFAQIPRPNLFIWNTMVRKLVDNKLDIGCSPLMLYRKMLSTGVRPNSHTFMYLIRALIPRMCIIEGEEVQSHVVKFGFECNQFVCSALVGFYVECGYVDRGRLLFDGLCDPGLILWTSMIRAYVRANYPNEALGLFGKMREVGVLPDPIALATIVSACTQLGSLNTAKTIHGFISKIGVDIDDFLCSALLGMYGECGSLDCACSLFHEIDVKNVVVWNTMIHQCIKYENLDKATELFKTMPCRDVVSWNTMIGGLTQMSRSKEAILLFHQMEMVGIKPNKSTMLSTLSACASLGALDTGTWIHAYIERNRLNVDGLLDPSLIDMYSKCGCIDKAIQVFDKVPRRDIFSWTSVICGLAMHGHGEQALKHFLRMQEAGVQPDDIVFVGVLNACAHAGLLDQGKLYLDSMNKVYGLTPKVEHFGCIIDLLGRKGCLEEAYNLIMDMPIEPNEVIWGSLLGACRVHNNVELGELVAKKMLELDPSDSWIRVMLSNIYAKSGKWEGSMKLRKEQKEFGLRKTPGCSSIEMNGKVHEFLVGHNSHPQQNEINSLLENIEMVFKIQ